jgi:hypothetical protein
MLRMRPRPVLLNADGYGLAAGVSRGIREAAEARCISGVSAIVTRPRWAEDGPSLAGVRRWVSLGLHLNLTLGAPLGPMPGLAPAGQLPSAGRLRLASLRHALDASEIKYEIGRQLTAFEAAVGFPPDHVDSHEHVHTLPGVRTAVLEALVERACAPRPLVRDPHERPLTIAMRSGEMAAAMGHTIQSLGFGRAARRRGFPTNAGFSGFSAFDTERLFAVELARAMRFAGRRHIVMCHPGHPDAELAALSQNTLRRGQELDAILGNRAIAQSLWRIERDDDAPPIDWDKAFPHVR